MLSDKKANVVELSALRQYELEPLVNQLGHLDLSRSEYLLFHAPSQMEQSYEQVALELLKQVAARTWPIMVHPDAMHAPLKCACLGDSLCIENMDKRKPIGQTATDLAKFIEALPKASLCFDIGHARQVIPR